MLFNQTSLITAGGWLIAILLLVFCICNKLYYGNKLEKLKAEIGAYKQVYEDNKRTIEELQNVNVTTSKILQEREEELDAIKSKSNQVQIQIKEVIKNDPKAKSWADTAVPDSVLSKLRSR